MFFQRYVHVVLDAVLGAYVKNIDPDALRISVWSGKIEVDALELQPDAFPLPAPLRLAKGTLHRLRIDLPWANLANEPIRVDIEAISLLLQVTDGDGRGDEDAELEAARLVKRRLQSLQRKRATLDAYEKASEFREQSAKQQPAQQQAGWTQSLLAKLLVKALDNLQVEVQHLHLRMEDAVSSTARPYAVGVTLDSLIIKSADEGWNYTMVVRSAAKAQAGAADDVSAAFLRKKMDINKFGVYWTTSLERVPQSALDDNREFAAVMQRSFTAAAPIVATPPSSSSSARSPASATASTPPPSSASSAGLPPVSDLTTMTPPASNERQDSTRVLFRQEDYLIHPLTVSMKLTINDGNAKLPLTHQELSQRVLSRLGTPWLVDTIDAIGDDAWREFVASMPKLAGGRKYTLGFVFSEAWSVARDLVEEEDAIPSVEQFKHALASCLQWAPRHVERLSPCITRYREAVVHIMDEKSTYIDAAATVDDINVSLRRQQYLSALSLISFLTVKKRQARYLKLRPVRVSVQSNPRAWWQYAIGAVLLDVRERLARVDWEEIRRTREQQQRYRELYALSTLAPLAATASTAVIGNVLLAQLVSPEVHTLSKDAVKDELDELEFVIDVQDLMKLRHAVKKEISRLKEKAEADKKRHASALGLNAGDASSGSDAVPASSRLWAYASWLVPGVGGATATASGTPSLAPTQEQLAAPEQHAAQSKAPQEANDDGHGSSHSSSGTSDAGSGAAAPVLPPALDDTDSPPTAVRAEDVKWSDQDAKDLYDAIDFHPDLGEEQNGDTEDDDEYEDDDDSVSRSSIPDDSESESTTTPMASMTPRRRRKQQRKRQAEQQHIWYRFQLHLSKVGFALSLEDVPLARATGASRTLGQSIASQRAMSGSAYLIASLDDAQIQFLVRPSSVEMGMQLRDAFFCQHEASSLDGSLSHQPRSRESRERQRMWRQRANVNDTDFFLERMAMREILQYHPADTRRQMSSVRLHECERELPLISLSIESERPQSRDAVEDEGEDASAPTGMEIPGKRRERLASSASASGGAAPSSVLRVSLVTQAIKCNANLLFLLDVVAVFSRPVNVDLSGLDQSAWKRAQSLQRYSAAQLNDALARRTKIELRLDVISPLINVIQSPITTSTRDKMDAAACKQLDGGSECKEVSLLVFLGHLQAATKTPVEQKISGYESSKRVASATSGGEACLYDVLEFSISGIEVQILDGDVDDHPFFSAVKASASTPALGSSSSLASSASSLSSWRYLLEKTSLTFSFHTSVTPSDPGIPLIKLFGGVASVHLNLSASSFRALMRLLRSFGADFSAHAQRRVVMDASRGVATMLMHDIGNGGASNGPSMASMRPQRQQKAEASARRDSGVFGSGGSSARSLSLRQRLDFDNDDIEIDDGADSEGGGNRMQAPAGNVRKDADDHDLLKLWKRVICQLEFVVGDVTVKLQLGEATDLPGKIVRARAADIRTHLTVRSFDRHLEFALGTFSLEELLFTTANPTPADVDDGRHAAIRYLMKSGSDIPSSDDDGSGEDEDHSEARSATDASDPSTPTQQLIAVAITSIASDAVLPKDQNLWSVIAYTSYSHANEFAIWQDPLLTPLSVDVSLQVLAINMYQHTFAEILVFFFRRDEEDEVEPEGEAEDDGGQVGDSPEAGHNQPVHLPHRMRAGTTLQDLVAGEESKADDDFDARGLLMAEPNDAALPTDDATAAWGSPSSTRTHDESTFSKKLGAWMTTSFLDNMSIPDKSEFMSSDKSNDPLTQDDDEETDRVLPASLQLRIHVDGLSLYLHLDDKKDDVEVVSHSSSSSTLFAVLTAQRFCCCMQRFPRFFSIYAYLNSLKICDASFSDKHLREIISHGDSPGGFKTAVNDKSEGSGAVVGHIPTLEEILDTIDRVPAVFSCAAQFYGADNIQQAWHPGYSSRYSVRLKAPRIRFLYSFIDDIRNYLFKGKLLETIVAVWARERAEMVWEGDFQLVGKTGSQSNRNRSDGGASSSGGGQHPHSSGAVNSNDSTGGVSPLRSSGGSSRRGYKRSQSSFHGAASGNSNRSSGSGSHFLGSDVVSMFPLVDLQLDDAVLEMPPHRMSSEALVLRFNHFRLSNEHVRASVEGMDNKIVAKVLLNSSLTQLKLHMSTLRIVSVILVDRGVIPSPVGADNPRSDNIGGGGFITQSLLGSTNFTLSVDFRSRTTYHLAMDFSPVRLVCNQEQYAFVLRVPMQNYRERSRYPFLRRDVPSQMETEKSASPTTHDALGGMTVSSPGQISRGQVTRSLSLGGALPKENETVRFENNEDKEHNTSLKRSATTPVTADLLEQTPHSDMDEHGNDGDEEQRHEIEEEDEEEEERYVVFEADIPEITMEILQGQEGYHPSDSGDLDMAEKGRSNNRGSICVLELSSYNGRADYSLTTGRFGLDMALGGIHIRDSRVSVNLADAYRDVVVFEEQPQRHQPSSDRVGMGVKALALQFSRETIAVDSARVDFEHTAAFRSARRASFGQQREDKQPYTPQTYRASPSFSGSRRFVNPRFRSASSRTLVGMFGRSSQYYEELSRGISDSSMSFSRPSSRPETSTPSHRGSIESGDESEERHTGTEVRMELIVEVAGFRVISSNIYYDVLQFLGRKSSADDDFSASDASDNASDRLDNRTMRTRSRSISDGGEGEEDEDSEEEEGEGEESAVIAVEAPIFRRISVDVTLGPSVVLMVEDLQKPKSRAVMLSWEATIGVDYLCQMNEEANASEPVVSMSPEDVHSDIGASSPRSESSHSTTTTTADGSKNQLQVCVTVENVHATSRLSEDSGIWAANSPERRGKTAMPPLAPRLRMLQQPTSADCLKPISLEMVLQLDLSTRFLRFRSTFDRVMELRFGYLDFCTVLSALEHTLRRPVVPSASSSSSLLLDANGMPLPMQRRRTSSGSSMSSLGSSNSITGDNDIGRGRRRSSSTEHSESVVSSGKGGHSATPSSDNARPIVAAVPHKIAARYGTSLIYLVSATFRGRIETRPVVGFYKTTWRKRYLVLPYSAHERTQVESVAFRILPAAGSRRKLGDPVYYGDRIILEAVTSPDKTDEGENDGGTVAESGEQSAAATSDADDRSTFISDDDGDEFDSNRSKRQLTSSVIGNGSVVCKYDQLGAIGYLGPDGTAGAFETTIWKHGSTMFNSDRRVIYDREVIVLEELTIYRSFGSGKQVFGGGQTSVDFTSARLDQQIEGTHAVGVTTGARGGGYLMFNGVGDAPIPLALSIVPPVSPSSHRRRRHRKRRQGDEGMLVVDDGHNPAPSIDTGDLKVADNSDGAPKNAKKISKKRRSTRRQRNRLRGFLTDLKVIEFTLPGVNATVINDFHNMLLPLLHFRIMNLHADIRGRFDDKLTALTSLRVGVQAYNSQLAVWEPVVEDFDVNAAFHARGGVLCDFCMSERHAVSPTGAALQCDGIPSCLFRDTRTEVFTSAASHAWEAKNFMYRELLDKGDDDTSSRDVNTFVVVVNGDLNVNVSRNVINVLLHFFALVTTANASKSSSAEENEENAEETTARLGPFIYVDNQSGIPFLVATHPASSAQNPGGPAHTGASSSPSRRETGSGSVEIPSEVPSVTDSNEDITQSETAAFHNHAWSRRRLSTLLHDISSPTTRWMRVESGQRLPTDIIAHEAPAGSVTSPLRRLLWLKPQSISRIQASSKPIPVPIGYSNRSYLHLESNSRNKVESWHGESVICETVAEQGTLVLRLRGKIQLTNYFSLPIQVVYNGERVEEIAPGARAAHYVPIQFLEKGTIAFRPVLANGKLQQSDPLRIAALLRSRSHHRHYGGSTASHLNYHRHQRNKSKQQPGALELRKALTFYWDELPASSLSTLGVAEESVGDSHPLFNASLPPFQMILTAARKSERHETLITLRPPIQLENLVPYELSYRTVCMKSEDEVVWVEKNSASFSGSAGRVSSGLTACIAELEILSGGEDTSDDDDDAVLQTPTTVGLSLAIPEIGLRRFSLWSKQAIIYGMASLSASFCERIELSMPERSGGSANAHTPGNKLTICVEVTQLDKLHSPALNALAPVVCRVFTEYWLIDRTSLSLAFYTADGFRIPSNYPAAGKAALLSTASDQTIASQSAISLSVYSSESTQHVSKMKIGIKVPTGREVQSDPFDISAVGVRGQILVPTSRSRESRSLLASIAEFGSDESVNDRLARKQYEFGVMVEQGPARFSRSRVVTLVPRFYLVNSSSRFDIHLRQERAGDRDVLILGPRESKVFHWTDYQLPPRVQVKFVSRGGGDSGSNSSRSSQWSAPFELSSVGNFVLRVKANPRPAPEFLPCCFEGGRSESSVASVSGGGNQSGENGVADDDSELFYDDEMDEEAEDAWQWRQQQQMLARDVQLNVMVELHDPSFFIYLEEGSDVVPVPSALPGMTGGIDYGTKDAAAITKKETGFVPYRVKNECGNLELVVWQKTFTKDDRGNVTVGYEGGETVLPFHTLDYVPYRFAASPTVVIHVQRVVGLLDSGASGKPKRGKAEGNSRSLRSRDAVYKASAGKAPSTVAALVDSVSHSRRVVAAFEVQLKKLQRLPTIDISDGKLKKRLWAEVLLDETSKTLLITDMLPGVSGEHKRRRRATLLRSWKSFNKSISRLSHALTVYSQPRDRSEVSTDAKEEMKEDEDAAAGAQKKKRVRFALDGDEDNGKKSGKSELLPVVTPPPPEIPPIVVSGLAVSVRLVEATGLEHLVAREGGRSSDWASIQPFLIFRLKAGGSETRSKILPQSSVVFPRWVPTSSANTVLSAFIRTSPSGTELDVDATAVSSGSMASTDSEIIVEIREPDRLLFSSSVIATVHVPLQDYVAAAIKTFNNSSGAHEPDVIEFLAPAVVKRKTKKSPITSDEVGAGRVDEDSPLSMVRFELSSQLVNTVVKGDNSADVARSKKSGTVAGDGAEDAAEPVASTTEALWYYELQKGLDALVLSKSQLKLLLEREAVDTSTGASAGNTFGKKAPTSSPPAQSSSSSSERKRPSGLSLLAIEDLEASSSQGSDSGDGSGGGGGGGGGGNGSVIGGRSAGSSQNRGSVASMTTDESTNDEMYEEMSDDKRLTAVVVGVNNLEIPTSLIARNAVHSSSRRYEPKIYCTVTYQESTRSALSVVAKRSTPQSSTSAGGASSTDEASHSLLSPIPPRHSAGATENVHLERVRTHEFPRGRRPLGLDLVYQNGRVIVQGVLCDSPCGSLLFEGKIRVGDTVVAVNHRSIVNLRRESSFAAIQRAIFGEEDGGADGDGSSVDEASAVAGTFSLSFLYQPDVASQRHFLRSSSNNVAGDRARWSASSSRQDDDRSNVKMYDAEWNRRVEFTEEKLFSKKEAGEHEDCKVLVRVYLRNETSDHGLSTSQESSIVPFLYFFGDDAMMDHLDHSKQDSRFDVLLAECWVPLPPSTMPGATPGDLSAADGASSDATSASAFHERICALYEPLGHSSARSAPSPSSFNMIGQLRLALKWDFIDPMTASRKQEDIKLYCQLEVARICVSIVDDASTPTTSSSGTASGSTTAASATGAAGTTNSGISTHHQPREVLCISLSNQRASAGIQLSYGLITDGRHVLNARVGHFQIDNQLLDTNYPVLLRPMRLVDAQLQAEGGGSPSATSVGDGGGAVDAMLLPTFQLMAVFSQQQPNVMQFEYIFGQLQELEIKLEDATLVALAQVFYGIDWSATSSSTASASSRSARSGGGNMAAARGRDFGSSLALRLLEKEWATPNRLLDDTGAGGNGGSARRGGNMKVLLRWLLLCPIKVNVTFTSTADRSLLLSLLSPDMSSALSTVIGAAAALVSNLDQAPIRVPEFYVENLLETTHTLAFYAMQHYIHHGLRSWYNIVGSVDFLGNPVGLVSTLGTGVKDFFYTPAQMLLEDEKGLRIENLRTGMTMGSKSLLRNTAVGIFHATGKITETLGKGIALLAMDEQYSAQRQRQSTRRQTNKVNDLGDAIAEGGRGLVGGVWDGIKGVVTAPVRGAEQAGAGGFVVGIGKGFAGLIVKPTAGFLDLLTSLSRGAKSSAEQLDGANERDALDGATRFRLPRRICADGVMASYSEREARGYAVLLLTSLDETDDYVFHVDYGMRPHRGLVMLTDKRIICLNASTGQKLWEVALDSRLDVVADGAVLKIGQSSAVGGGSATPGASSAASASARTYSIECDDAVAASNFRVAVDSARVDLSATRYLLLNLEKNQEEARNGRRNRVRRWRRSGDDQGVDGDERAELDVFMENVQDTTVTGVSAEDLASQPIRSVRVELCHLLNKDAHANVPHRPIDRLLSFSVYQVQVYGGPYQWSVYRRFSEFRDLCARLEALGAPLDALPPLPPRTIMPSTRNGVAKHRQEALNIFLQAASMHSVVSRSAPMLEFLTREAREVRVSLPPLSPTGGGGGGHTRRAATQRPDAAL